MRIAILQRDPVMRQSIEKILTSAGHTCAGYDDGLTMSKTLARSTVDLLVLDWHGTRLSGTEVLRTARAVGGDRVPVIFASRDTSEESMVRAFVNGADDYTALPVRPAEFRERVAALLRRAYPDRFSTSSFDVGPYRFDICRRPQSLTQQGVLHSCSKFVQNCFRQAPSLIGTRPMRQPGTANRMPQICQDQPGVTSDDKQIPDIYQFDFCRFSRGKIAGDQGRLGNGAYSCWHGDV